MNKSKINFLRIAYEEFWVPVFGRVLSFFIRFIEGRPPSKEPTYDLREKRENLNGS